MGASRSELVRAFVPTSPLVGLLGIELVHVGGDEARLRLPWRAELATLGDVVHGGAIAALVDTAGMAAAWADDDTEPAGLGGATVSMTVDYVAAARGADLLATARAVRRGRSLCFCEVTVTEPGGGVVAKGLVTHRFAS